MLGKLTFLAGLGVGFLAGSRQGRAPYERFSAMVSQRTGGGGTTAPGPSEPTGATAAEPPLI